MVRNSVHPPDKGGRSNSRPRSRCSRIQRRVPTSEKRSGTNVHKGRGTNANLMHTISHQPDYGDADAGIASSLSTLEPKSLSTKNATASAKFEMEIGDDGDPDRVREYISESEEGEVGVIQTEPCPKDNTAGRKVSVSEAQPKTTSAHSKSRTIKPGLNKSKVDTIETLRKAASADGKCLVTSTEHEAIMDLDDAFSESEKPENAFNSFTKRFDKTHDLIRTEKFRRDTKSKRKAARLICEPEKSCGIQLTSQEGDVRRVLPQNLAKIHSAKSVGGFRQKSRARIENGDSIRGQAEPKRDDSLDSQQVQQKTVEGPSSKTEQLEPVDDSRRKSLLALRIVRGLADDMSQAIVFHDYDIAKLKMTLLLIRDSLPQVNLLVRNVQDGILRVQLEAERLGNVLEMDEPEETRDLIEGIKTSMSSLILALRVGDQIEECTKVRPLDNVNWSQLATTVNRAIARIIPESENRDKVRESHIKPLQDCASSIQQRSSTLLEFYHNQQRDNISRMHAKVNDSTTSEQFCAANEVHDAIQHDVDKMLKEAFEQLIKSVQTRLEILRGVCTGLNQDDFDAQCKQVVEMLRYILRVQIGQATYLEPNTPSF